MTLPIDLRTVLCTSCGARMIFLTTKTGRLIPVDADTVAAQDTEFDKDRHKTHFATCPNSDKHRKPKT